MNKKECPSCAMEVPAKSKECPVCGYEFTDGRNKITKWIVLILALLLLLYFIF